MKRLYPVTQVVAKILEVCHWVGAVALLVLFVLTLLPGELFIGMIQPATTLDASMKVYSFELMLCTASGELSRTAVAIFSLSGGLILGLMAMVFRNVWLIVKTARGKTRFSSGSTPFQADVTRMIREIGIFQILTVVVALVFEAVAVLALGPEAVEAALDPGALMLGLLMLCLSQMFSDGTRLQQDVDGLL